MAEIGRPHIAGNAASQRWHVAILLYYLATLGGLTGGHTRHGDGVFKERAPQNCVFVNRTVMQCKNRSTEFLSVPPGVTHLHLDEVDPDGTLDVGGLVRLRWTHSFIKDFVQILDNPQSLLELDLSHNSIRSLSDPKFKNYTNLVLLNVSDNAIDDLPRNIFKSHESIRRLSLSHNSLKAIPFQVFSPIELLEELDLSYNNLFTLLDHFFKFNRNIEKLLLNNNNITKISSNALADLIVLQHLDLSHNSLQSISKGLFDPLLDLQYLNLANNPLTNLASGTLRGLRNLRSLNLSGNKITQLSFGLLHFSPLLNSLTLDNTMIEVLHNSELLGVANLEILNIRKNKKLREIESYFFADTPILKELDIRGNDLTFLPESIVNLTQLKRLNISDNPWGCDCRMFWFAPWIMKMKKTNIILSDLSCGHSYPNDMLLILQHLNCTSPRIVFKTPTKQYRLKTDALLECRYEAYPLPSITWVTPLREVYHWNPDPSIHDVFSKHPHAHDEHFTPLRIIPLGYKCWTMVRSG